MPDYCLDALIFDPNADPNGEPNVKPNVEPMTLNLTLNLTLRTLHFGSRYFAPPVSNL